MHRCNCRTTEARFLVRNCRRRCTATGRGLRLPPRGGDPRHGLLLGLYPARDRNVVLCLMSAGMSTEVLPPTVSDMSTWLNMARHVGHVFAIYTRKETVLRRGVLQPTCQCSGRGRCVDSVAGERHRPLRARQLTPPSPPRRSPQRGDHRQWCRARRPTSSEEN
jgi:hypothetical protein